MNEHVLVFRKRLLAYSETFIADQGQYLPNMKAVFTGFKWDNSGSSLLEGLDTCIQQDYALHAGLARLRLRLGMGLNKKWRQALRAYQPRLIHAHFGPDALAAIPIAKTLQIPLIATFHGFDITKQNSSTSYQQHRHQVFEHAQAVIAVSNYIKDQLIDAGCPAEKIIQHYIGINTEHFSMKKQESENPCIVFVGRLVEKKGCAYLLAAMKLIQQHIPNVELRIIGDGPLRSELQEQAANLNNVQFLGVQNKQEVKEHLSQAWVFCTPSIIAESGDAEGLGMVFLEAQALQTPAVSFDTGGVVEAIADGETGLNIAEKNVEALAEGLLDLLDNKEKRHAYGLAGQARVLDQFDIRKQCEKLEAIYRQVLAQS